MRRLTDTLNREMTYEPESTRVDTSADEAVAARQGRLPGLRAPRGDAGAAVRHPLPLRERLPRVDRREGRSPGRATRGSRRGCRGWGGPGSIPTHNIVTGVHHIRVAVGRDYADVPPTRGVCKGEALGRLAVAVGVWEAGAAPAPDTSTSAPCSPTRGPCPPVRPGLSRPAVDRAAAATATARVLEPASASHACGTPPTGTARGPSRPFRRACPAWLCQSCIRPPAQGLRCQLRSAHRG